MKDPIEPIVFGEEPNMKSPMREQPAEVKPPIEMPLTVQSPAV